MTHLCLALDDYLATRRGLGYSLGRTGRLLADFVSQLDAAGEAHITTQFAVDWAILPRDAHPHWWRQRLGIVRGFAQYLKALDPATEVPPADLLSAHRPRLAPHLYSDADIAALLQEARTFTPALRAATYETLIGLLAVTGLRLGEALGLDRGDVDFVGGVLAVHRAKLSKPREVPLHETTVDALRRFARIRDRHWPKHPTSFFVSAGGGRLDTSAVHYAFAKVVDRAALPQRGDRCRPRLHDLRHSFAVHTLLHWYEAGVDVQTHLPLLSTYLGHVNPASTYWYLQASPDLLALSGQRLEGVLGNLP